MGVPERIREAASINGLNLKEFSERLGVSYRTIQNYVSEERGVGSEFLVAAAERLGVSSTWILTGLGAPLIRDGVTPEVQPHDGQFIPVPRYPVDASAGHGSLVQDDLASGTYAYNRAFLERRGLKPENLAVISVRGDSMEPDLHNGDLILIDRAEVQRDTIKDGGIYVITYGGDLYVKRVQRLPNERLLLASSNPAYQPITVEATDMGCVRIIGRVVNSSHEW